MTGTSRGLIDVAHQSGRVHARPVIRIDGSHAWLRSYAAILINHPDRGGQHPIARQTPGSGARQQPRGSPGLADRSVGFCDQQRPHHPDHREGQREQEAREPPKQAHCRRLIVHDSHLRLSSDGSAPTRLMGSTVHPVLATFGCRHVVIWITIWADRQLTPRTSGYAVGWYFGHAQGAALSHSSGFALPIRGRTSGWLVR